LTSNGGCTAGQRPSLLAKVLNRAWAAVGSSGVASNYLVTFVDKDAPLSEFEKIAAAFPVFRVLTNAE